MADAMAGATNKHVVPGHHQ